MTVRKILTLFLVLFLISIPQLSSFVDGGDENNNGTSGILRSQYESVPPSISGSGRFVGNKGQFGSSDILYAYLAQKYHFRFFESGYFIDLTEDNNISTRLTVSFPGANRVIPRGLDELPQKSNYLKGNDPDNWRTNVSNFGKLVYDDLYDGIDLEFYFSEKGLKYDFIISSYTGPDHPSTDPETINIHYDGEVDLNIDASGNLHIRTPSGELVEEAPFSYQDSGQKKVEIISGFRIHEDVVRFEIGHFDPGLPLVIDPLIYSTYLGGSESDHGLAMCVDDEGNAFITGDTYSSDFPLSHGAYDDSFNGVRDIFVFKLSADGSEMIYSTFIGGNNNDVSRGITVDDEGNVYVTGRSESDDFPTTAGAYDEDFNGDCDVIVFKLNHDGSDLVYSTYVGGNNYEVGYSGIAIDGQKNAYVAGHTNSPNFPTTPGAYDRTYYCCGWDGFAFKLNPQGSDLVYSTYFGGWDYEGGRCIAVDAEGQAIIGGDTTSNDFPTTTGAYDENYNGERDGFILKMNADGSDLVYSSFLGGIDDDLVNDLNLLEDGRVWMTGYTFSQDFPTSSGAYASNINGERDVFVSLLVEDGSNFTYSSFVGGSDTDEGWTVVGDGDEVFLAGRSRSDDFPVTENALEGNRSGSLDMVILVIDPEEEGEEGLSYSTYFGGSDNEAAWDMMLAGEDIIISGLTASEDHQVTPGAYDEDYNGGAIDAVVLRLNTKPEGDGNPGGGNGGGGNDDNGTIPDGGDNITVEQGEDFELLGMDGTVFVGVIASIAIVLVVVISGFVFFRKNRIRMDGEPEDACPDCGERGTYSEEAEDHYCWNCEGYFEEM